MTSRALIKTRPRALALSALVGTALAGCGTHEANARFCAVAEGSVSTQTPEIRTAYSTAFNMDLDWFAKQPGDQPMCLILAVGNPTVNPIPTLGIHPEDPHSRDAAQTLDDNVSTAVEQFASVLAQARDLVGTPLAEALYALAERGELRPGDTISVYSDMREFSVLAKIPDITRINNARAQRTAIDAALDRLAAGGLLPDGREGRPSLQGIRIVAPVTAVTAPVSDPADQRAEPARQVATHEFWVAWAERVHAKLVWNKGADGGRRAR